MTAWQWVLAASAAVILLSGALASILKIFGIIDRGMKRFNEFIDDWRGEPARKGYPPRLGVPERLERIEDRLDRVEAQLLPKNGGVISTLRDSVDRIEQTVVPPEDAGD